MEPRANQSTTKYDPHAPRPKRLTGKLIKCLYCKNDFYAPGWRLRDNVKYCSPSHYWLSKLGKTTWNKGIEGSVKPNKTSFFPNGMTFEGTMKEYKHLHWWVYKILGKPLICERCGYNKGGKKMMHWANRSHRYLKHKLDWIALCAKCHFNYDKEFRYQKA